MWEGLFYARHLLFAYRWALCVALKGHFSGSVPLFVCVAPPVLPFYEHPCRSCTFTWKRTPPILLFFACFCGKIGLFGKRETVFSLSRWILRDFWRFLAKAFSLFAKTAKNPGKIRKCCLPLDKEGVVCYNNKALKTAVLPGRRSRYRDVAQFGRAPRSGRGSRRFESCHLDQNENGHRMCPFLFCLENERIRRGAVVN